MRDFPTWAGLCGLHAFAVFDPFRWGFCRHLCLGAMEGWAAFCGSVGGRFTDQMSILSEPEFCGGHVSFAYSLLSLYRQKEGFRLPLLRKHEEFMTSGKRSRYCNVPDVCSRAHCHSPFCATQASVALEGGPADRISRVEALMIVLWVCCCC